MMTCVSRDRLGNVNNIVFRFTRENICQIRAKWLFSHGRQATFGLDKVDPTKPVHIVEGFYDWVAMVEMGYTNTVGLGSAFISEAHERFLEGLELVFVLDSDETGKKYSDRLRGEGRQVLYLNDECKDPYEYWIQKGTLRLNE
jgi:DNA primase